MYCIFIQYVPWPLPRASTAREKHHMPAAFATSATTLSGGALMTSCPYPVRSTNARMPSRYAVSSSSNGNGAASSVSGSAMPGRAAGSTSRTQCKCCRTTELEQPVPPRHDSTTVLRRAWHETDTRVLVAARVRVPGKQAWGVQLTELVGRQNGPAPRSGCTSRHCALAASARGSSRGRPG